MFKSRRTNRTSKAQPKLTGFYNQVYLFEVLSSEKLSIYNIIQNTLEAKKLILTGLVDAKYRFIWAGSGWAGNTHDSTVFQSTNLYKKIVHEQLIPDIKFFAQNVSIGPIILGDGAFPLQPWWQKPYSNATMTREQKYFNYRLSRARIVVEAAFGMLKGRWRVLQPKCEASKEVVRSYSLACIILHNLCIERGDTLARYWVLKKNSNL